MLICFVIYIFVCVCIVSFKRKIRDRVKIFPKICATKNGLVFNSNDRHKINISNARYNVFFNKIIIKQSGKSVIIDNVCEVEKKKDFLYFTGNGRVEIFINYKDLYKYFNINIGFENINFVELKRLALLDIINNPFNFECQKYFKLYMRIINKVLKINIDNKYIVVEKNQYKLPFEICYRLNGKIYKIKFQCR